MKGRRDRNVELLELSTVILPCEGNSEVPRGNESAFEGDCLVNDHRLSDAL